MFQAGFTAVHLAAQNGHLAVLEVLRSSQSLKISSKRLGMTALHMAAYCGQTGTLKQDNINKLHLLTIIHVSET